MKLRELINNSFTSTVATILAPATGGISVAALGLMRKFTGKPTATEDELARDLVSMSSEKTAELQVAMEELANKELGMLLKDRQGARSMAVALKDTAQAWIQPALAVIAVGGFFYVIYALMGGLKVSTESREILFMLLGILASTFKDVYQFYFGSSKGSKDKSILLQSKS